MTKRTEVKGIIEQNTVGKPIVQVGRLAYALSDKVVKDLVRLKSKVTLIPENKATNTYMKTGMISIHHFDNLIKEWKD